MSFHEVRFPASLSYGSFGGPERKTDIVRLANGYEQRNSSWQHSRRRYDAGLGMRSLENIYELISFFEARRGQLYGFRWKDWSDYRSNGNNAGVSPFDQEIGTGDGSSRNFQLQKNYVSGEQNYTRQIKKPVDGTLVVALDGVQLPDTEVTVDNASGIITFEVPPGAGSRITAGFEFDVPVRFDTDYIQTSVASFQAGNVPDVPIVEIRI